MTYEQEFGASINQTFAAAGFTRCNLGGNLTGWCKTLESGIVCTITAYEGQQYADPSEAVWSAFWANVDGEELGGGLDATLQECVDGHRSVPGLHLYKIEGYRKGLSATAFVYAASESEAVKIAGQQNDVHKAYSVGVFEPWAD